MKHKIFDLARKQGFKNAGWSVMSAIVYPLLMLFATPLFITKLGDNQFGIWMLVNSISQVMNIFNMGLGDANIRYISKYNAVDNKVEIRILVSTIMGASYSVTCLCIFTGIGLAYVIDYNNLFEISSANKDLAFYSIQLAFVIFALKFLEIILLSTFQGFERYDVQSRFSLLSKVSILIGNLFFISLGKDLVFILIVSAIIQFTAVLLEVYFIKARYSFLTFAPSFSKTRLKKIFDFSLWTWLQSVLAIGSSQADKFVVAYYSGVQTLSYYSLGYMVMTQVHSVYSSLASWIFPVVSKKSTKGESLNEMYHNAEAILLTFGFLSILFLVGLEKPILTLWLGQEVYEKAAEYIYLFLYYNVFLLLNILPFFFLNGSGEAKYNTYSEFFTRSLNLIGMFALYSLMGNMGLIWGHVISMLISTPIKISLMKKFVTHQKNRYFGVESLVSGICLILLFENESVWVKILFGTLFITSFYWIHLRQSALFKRFFYAG